MITKKQAEQLRQAISRDEKPVLHGQLYYVFCSAEFYALNNPKNPYFLALVHAGIVTNKGKTTEVGKWYHTTINGYTHRILNK